ncbi:hypothetical protein [Stieleria varia]|nr:hypothetical protein [Stieleria varia]
MSIRTRIASAMLATAAVFCVAPLASGQEKLAPIGTQATLTDGTQPVLVVTLGSVSKLMADVNYITGVAGQPQAGGMFQMFAGMFTQGMNMNLPIGVIVPMVNGAPEPIVTIPTDDIRTVLKRLEAQTGPVDELDDGTLVITVNQNTVYVRQLGAWAVAARNRDVIALAPSDPTTLFSGMGNDYDLAVRLQVQQIPTEIRDMLIAQMRQGFEGAMRQQNPDEAAAREMAEQSIQQIEQIVREADELNFGWNIDQNARELVFDVAFTAVPGSNMAAIYSGQKIIPSAFASVVRDDAAAYFHGATAINPEGVAQYRGSIDSSMTMIRNAIANENNLSDDELAEIDSVLGRLGDLIGDTLAEGKSDSGMVLLADENQFRLAFGMFLADGNKAAQLVKDLSAKVPAGNPDAPRFKFDLGKYNGVQMHVVEADVPASEDEVRKVFGDMLQVHLGTGDKSLYLALGRDSEALLKELIDSGATAGMGPSVFSMKVKLLPILQFAQSVEMNDEVAAVIDSLSEAGDQGVLNITGDSIPNGSKSRVSIGEGLIRAIGAAAAAAQPGRGAPAPF